MRLFYRIFIHPTAAPTATSAAYNVGSDKNSNENNNSGGGERRRDANNSSSSNESSNLNESQGSAESSSSPSTSSSTPVGRGNSGSGTGDTGNHPCDSSASSSSSSVTKSDDVGEGGTSGQGEVGVLEAEYDSKLIVGKGGGEKEKEPLKLVLAVSKKSDKSDAKIIYSKSGRSPKQHSPSASTSSGFGDFKRLRSNDIRYSDYETSPSSASSSKSGTVPGGESRKSEPQSGKKHSRISSDCNSESSGKKLAEDKSRNKVNGGASSAVAITELSGGHTTTEKNGKSSELKCYVNLKKQIVSPASSAETSANRNPEVPKLRIELPSLKTKISIPKPDTDKSPKSAHSSSTSSSAATSPTASSSASGKSPIWPRPDDSSRPPMDVSSIGIEEYAKTIGLKPVHRVAVAEGDSKKKKKSSTSASPEPSFHRKRKKAKHSKEAGGKRRKLHAEISSQQDESLKMKVKLTEKPSKHERKPSEEISAPPPKELTKQNAEVAASSSVVVPKEDDPKVIDITKGDDDDDVKIIEQPSVVMPRPANVTEKGPGTRVNDLPKLSALTSPTDTSSTKAKINEMRAIRHKPMVYIPNLDKNLSDNSSTINSIIQSVQAKTGFIDKDSDVQIVSTMPSLVPTKPTISSMKPPTMIPSTVASKTVPSNSIPKSQQKTQQIFSPRHTPSYPPLALQSAPKKLSVAPNNNSTNAYQPRHSVPAFKRSSSVDSGGTTYNIPPKTPRVDLMEANAQNRMLKKPIYAPMFNFVKGASLAKNGTTNSMPTSANDVPYKSPISSTYTKEIGSKKPVPSLLLPPSSISVTKMTDTVPQPPRIDNRPALEIVRIPSTAPVADKPQPKAASRPPPPTIPLIKIKKSASLPDQPISPISPSVFQVTSSSTNSSINLTTSSASSQDTSGALDLTTRTNDDLIILESSDSLTSKLNGNDSKAKPAKPDMNPSSQLELINSLIKLQGGIPGLKLPADMIGYAITSPSSVPKLTSVTYSSTSPSTTVSKSIPMPRLAEINRNSTVTNRNVAVRQPNPSVRSIPNPSALAFRNQAAITSLSPTTSSSKVMNVNMRTNNSTAQKSSVNNNGTGSLADAYPSMNALARAPGTVPLLSTNLNGNSNNNNNSTSINNKNDNVSSTTAAGGNKKTIEKVAAGLRAAQATATAAAMNGGSGRVSSSNGNATGLMAKTV